MTAQAYALPHLFTQSAPPAPGTLFPDWPARSHECSSQSFAVAREKFESEFILKALRENGGNVSRTARAIGMSRRNLQMKIEKLGIDTDLVRPGQ